MTTLHVDVYCGRAPTMIEVLNVRDLVLRTQRRSGRNYYNHMLMLRGDFASFFLLHCQGVNLNITTQKHPVCDLGIVIGTAPPSFYSRRKQVLTCPTHRLERQ
ncbi:hypothetical protein YOLOSWAG_118 [Erwinia phage vB_EamM_Yoloswag]|uniref:Uncharacterized protein n=1 Tax=Erwinia phage vB_EamM_Yoloswag TaxID=1958956 RepID=A0A1S6L3S2_9CAUD|nr:hypothetical protein HOR66_gp118 [Erwinia phage vB_EamM_Yoloswag]AQT28817.1 hypothetical protein YOLOSWAG_118 [Erwinia phage vB_EamM_Yoloswag]